MALTVLTNELFQLTCDIQNDKITVRMKALKRLDELFNTRLDELKDIVDATDEKDENGVTWNDLFDASYGGIFKVCEKEIFLLDIYMIFIYSIPAS